MADTQEKQPKQKKEKKEKKAAPETRAQEAPSGEPAPRARLLDHYEQKVRGKLQQQFGYVNTHQIPKLVKIVLNVGIGDASKNPKTLEAAVAELEAITGQKAMVRSEERRVGKESRSR